jgi:hypothetical protein
MITAPAEIITQAITNQKIMLLPKPFSSGFDDSSVEAPDSFSEESESVPPWEPSAESSVLETDSDSPEVAELEESDISSLSV